MTRLGAIQIGAAIVSGLALVTMSLFIKLHFDALEARIAKLESPAPADSSDAPQTDRAQTDAIDRKNDAIRKCRAMGQTPAMGFGWNVVCLQSPAVAFTLDPGYPDR
jgi:hypothetical protein